MKILTCPKCNQHTEISIEKDVFHIMCRCHYYSTMKIKDCINVCKGDMPYNPTINDDTIKNINNGIKKGNEHLLTYFEKLNQLFDESD